MKNNRYHFDAKVWLYPGATPWHFVTVPKKQSEEIEKRFRQKEHGWRSLPVRVTVLQPGSRPSQSSGGQAGQVGATTWKTSVFYDKRAGGYILPLKAEVRKKEKIKNSSAIAFTLEIMA